MRNHENTDRGVNRRQFLRMGFVLGGGAALLAACQGPAATPTATTAAAKPASASSPAAAAASPAAKPAASPSPGAAASPAAKPAASPAAGQPRLQAATPAEWDALVAAARSEGTVTVYATAGDAYREAYADAFERAYPGIKVDATYGAVFDVIPRVVAERQAGKFIPDIFSNGSGPSVTTMKPAGMLAPLPPALVHPEVVNTNNWFQNRLWWADAAEPYTTVSFQGSVNSAVAYNKNLINPAEFNSYQDLLNPKWKGKIVATDIRNPGPGAVPARFLYKHPQLGRTFLDQLFSTQDLVLSSDQRQLIDWLAQGQYPLGVFLHFGEVGRAAEQGLPIAVVPGERFREGIPMGPGPGAVNIMDKAPHPNAAKLYVNWLLSKDGQTAWQRATRENSLRTDIPKTGLLPFNAPEPGVTYVDASTEEYSLVTSGILAEVINTALAKKS